MTYFYHFWMNKIHFENFRFSARKWLSVQWVKNFEFLQINIFGIFEPRWCIFIILEWKNPFLKVSIFSSKMTLSPIGEKFRIFAKDFKLQKITVFGIFKPKWHILINFRMKKATLKIFDFQLKNDSQSNGWKMSTFCKGSQSSKNHWICHF